jgi:hypothetical protein
MFWSTLADGVNTSGWHMANKGALREFFARNPSRRLIRLNEQKYSGQVSSGRQQRARRFTRGWPSRHTKTDHFFPPPPPASPSCSPFALCAPVLTGWYSDLGFLWVNPAPLFRVECAFMDRIFPCQKYIVCQHFEYFREIL